MAPINKSSARDVIEHPATVDAILADAVRLFEPDVRPGAPLSQPLLFAVTIKAGPAVMIVEVVAGVGMDVTDNFPHPISPTIEFVLASSFI